MLKVEEVAFILRHAGAEILATDSEFADLANSASGLNTNVRDFVWLPSEGNSTPSTGMISFDELSSTFAEPPQVELSGSDLLQIVYTSGTEAQPKGAMLTHDAIIWQYVSCVVDASISAEDLTLHALPLSHGAQLDVFLGPAIYVGGTNVITAKPTPESLLPLIQRHCITSFFALQQCGFHFYALRYLKPRICRALERATTAFLLCPLRSCAKWPNECRAYGCGIFMDKLRSHRSPPCLVRRINYGSPDLAGAQL
jgi:acyl-CoA synthetase (AMP-forming)/AMP-acid ligase II